jgi:hypothetical protein
MLGAHYETRGVDPDYMQIDYWPVARLGLHGGIKFRVGKTVDLVFSYSHMIQETLTVGAPPAPPGQGGVASIFDTFSKTGVVTQIDKHAGAAASRGDVIPVLTEPAPAHIDGTARVVQNTTQVAASAPPWIINAGTYRSSIDVVAIGANVHF